MENNDQYSPHAHLATSENNAIDDLKEKKNINYEIEETFLRNKINKFGFIVIGPPRVGKSTLINKMTNADLKVSPNINSCTKNVKEVCINVDFKDNNGRSFKKDISFFDTPGIEEWGNFEKTLDEFYKDKVIISTMICLSPGCFANEDKIETLMKTLMTRETYIQLIITNMYSGSKEQFEAILKFYKRMALKLLWNPSEEIFNNKRDVLLKYKQGMIVSINSKDFVDHNENNIPIKNVEDMLEAMFESIDDDKIAGLYFAVINNRSFLTKLEHKIKGIYFEKIIPFFKDNIESIFYNGQRIFNVFPK